MTEQEIIELRRWSAENLMGWYTKGNKPTCYYYDNNDRRVGTIRNWCPDWKWSGQIWSVLRRMAELGFHHTIYDSYNSKGKYEIVRFYKGSNMCSIEEANNPCLAILIAARTALNLTI